MRRTGPGAHGATAPDPSVAADAPVPGAGGHRNLARMSTLLSRPSLSKCSASQASAASRP